MSRVTRQVALIAGFGPPALVVLCLSACGGGNHAAPPAKPTVSFSVSPSTIQFDGAATLTWSSTDATTCTAPWESGSLPAAGSTILSGLVGAGASSFSITCTGPGGSATASAAFTVEAAALPTVSFSANSAIVAQAGMDTLTWTTTGAGNCVALDGWSGEQPVSGSTPVGPITKQTKYTLTCSGEGGVASSSVTVGVSSTLPPAGPIAKLAPGVMLVNGPLLLQNANYIVISGTQTTLAPGSIFILGGTAHKVASVLFTQGDPTLFPPDFISMPVVEVTTVPPALDEVFDQIDLSGVYTLDASQMAAQSTAVRAKSKQEMRLSLTSHPDAAASITIPLNLNEPSLQITGTGNVALQANVNVHYSKAGGFANSSMVLSTSTQASLDVSTTAAVSQSASALSGHFIIPIPLTVIDAQANLIAVTAASVDVPISVIAQPAAGYLLGYHTSLQGSALTSVTISSEGALSETVDAGMTTNEFTLSNATASPDPSSPAGFTLGASVFAGLDFSASLQLLNSVNLVTADSKVGDRYSGALEFTASGSNPAYCGGAIGELELQATASLGLSTDIFTAPVPPPLRNGSSDVGPQPIVGYCNAQPLVVGNTSATATLFSPSAIFVNVVPLPGTGSPQPNPTGVVRATLNGANCDAAIDSTGNGSCDLTPMAAGARSLNLQYLGDSNYSAGQPVSQPVNVALAQPVVTLTFTPNPSSFASTIIFSYSVTASPQNIGQPVPSGNVTVTAFGITSCNSAIDVNGQGSCMLQTPSLPPSVAAGNSFTLVSAAYSGDGNYLPANSAGAPLPVIGLSVNYQPGITAIRMGDSSLLVVNAASAITDLASPIPPNLTWTSSDPAVASVAAGNVTAIAVGTATITVTDPASAASASILVSIVAPAS